MCGEQRTAERLDALRAVLRANLQRPVDGAQEGRAEAASRQAVIERGFVLVWLGVQAEGSLRHVFWRPAGRPATAPAAGEAVWLDAEDLVAQQQLLATGWIGARVRPGDTAIGFVQAGP